MTLLSPVFCHAPHSPWNPPFSQARVKTKVLYKEGIKYIFVKYLKQDLGDNNSLGKVNCHYHKRRWTYCVYYHFYSHWLAYITNFFVLKWEIRHIKRRKCQVSERKVKYLNAFNCVLIEHLLEHPDHSESLVTTNT